MDTLTAIKTRRSIRNYWGEVLGTDLIFEIASYWLCAPSAHNQQARKFYVISKKKDRIFLSEVMEYWKMLTNAWGCILACFDGGFVRSMEFIQQDMWASIQNILLAAHEKWIWTVRLWLYPHEEPMNKIKEYFKFPDNVIPFAIISMWIKEGEVPDKNLKSEWKIEVI